jgi:hypothetical protein
VLQVLKFLEECAAEKSSALTIHSLQEHDQARFSMSVWYYDPELSKVREEWDFHLEWDDKKSMLAIVFIVPIEGLTLEAVPNVLLHLNYLHSHFGIGSITLTLQALPSDSIAVYGKSLFTLPYRYLSSIDIPLMAMIFNTTLTRICHERLLIERAIPELVHRAPLRLHHIQ